MDRLAYLPKCAATGKVRFHTRLAAKASGKKWSWRMGKKYRAYQCPSCGQWHLSTQKPRA